MILDLVSITLTARGVMEPKIALQPPSADVDRNGRRRFCKADVFRLWES